MPGEQYFKVIPHETLLFFLGLYPGIMACVCKEYRDLIWQNFDAVVIKNFHDHFPMDYADVSTRYTAALLCLYPLRNTCSHCAIQSMDCIGSMLMQLHVRKQRGEDLDGQISHLLYGRDPRARKGLVSMFFRLYHLYTTNRGNPAIRVGNYASQLDINVSQFLMWIGRMNVGGDHLSLLAPVDLLVSKMRKPCFFLDQITNDKEQIRYRTLSWLANALGSVMQMIFLDVPEQAAMMAFDCVWALFRRTAVHGIRWQNRIQQRKNELQHAVDMLTAEERDAYDAQAALPVHQRQYPEGVAEQVRLVEKLESQLDMIIGMLRDCLLALPYHVERCARMMMNDDQVPVLVGAVMVSYMTDSQIQMAGFKVYFGLIVTSVRLHLEFHTSLKNRDFYELIRDSVRRNRACRDLREFGRDLVRTIWGYRKERELLRDVDAP